MRKSTRLERLLPDKVLDEAIDGGGDGGGIAAGQVQLHGTAGEELPAGRAGDEARVVEVVERERLVVVAAHRRRGGHGGRRGREQERVGELGRARRREVRGHRRHFRQFDLFFCLFFFYDGTGTESESLTAVHERFTRVNDPFQPMSRAKSRVRRSRRPLGH